MIENDTCHVIQNQSYFQLSLKNLVSSYSHYIPETPTECKIDDILTGKQSGTSTSSGNTGSIDSRTSTDSKLTDNESQQSSPPSQGTPDINVAAPAVKTFFFLFFFFFGFVNFFCFCFCFCFCFVLLCFVSCAVS